MEERLFEKFNQFNKSKRGTDGENRMRGRGFKLTPGESLILTKISLFICLSYLQPINNSEEKYAAIIVFICLSIELTTGHIIENDQTKRVTRREKGTNRRTICQKLWEN